jgi:hypothetical protein
LTGRRDLLAALLVVVLCTAGLAALRLDFMIPHDEGLLGQAAERTLGGELPHVDFDDAYTGGQAFFHAAAFELFGHRSSVLRGVLLAASVFFILVFFALARRLLGTWPAAGLTVLAVAWSLPCYFAAMPSWYNLFLAIFGVAALELGGGRFPRLAPFAAGLCAGFSILFKVVGLYWLVAAALAILYRLQLGDRAREGAPAHGSGPLPAAIGALGLASVAAMALVVRHDLGIATGCLFLLPAAALALLLVREELRPKARPWPERARGLGLALGLLAAGCALPIALFAVPYARVDGGLAALWQGVVATPQLRVGLASLPLPGWRELTLGLPALALLAWAARGRAGRAWLAAAAGLAAACALSAPSTWGHDVVWSAVRLLTPLVVVHGCWLLDRPSAEGDARLFLVGAAATWQSLVQYPYADATYFHYAAPLVALAYAAWLRPNAGDDAGERSRRRWGLAALGVALYLFAALWLHRSNVFAFGLALQPRAELALALPERMGLRIPAGYAERYPAFLRFLQAQAPPGKPILALPDTPETYFFAERRNPTRYLFDALTAEPMSIAQLQRLLPQVALVVVNHQPGFSPPLDAERLALIYAEFPRGAALGPLEVRYRER